MLKSEITINHPFKNKNVSKQAYQFVHVYKFVCLFQKTEQQLL